MPKLADPTEQEWQAKRIVGGPDEYQVIPGPLVAVGTSEGAHKAWESRDHGNGGGRTLSGPAAPSPSRASPRDPLNGLPGPAELDAMEHTGGPLGSQGGGWYKDANGQRYLVKPGQSKTHAMNELAAHLLYKQAGVPTDDTGIFEQKGKWFVVKKAIQGPDGKLGKQVGNGGMTPDMQRQAQDGFGIDTLASSWDAFGLVGDNVIMQGGTLHRIDVGGSMMYRAMGGDKASFNPGQDWIEPSTLRTSNQGKQLYGHFTDTAAALQLAKLHGLDVSAYDKALHSIGIDDKVRERIVTTIRDRIDRQLPGILHHLNPKASFALEFAGTSDGAYKAWDSRGRKEQDEMIAKAAATIAAMKEKARLEKEAKAKPKPKAPPTDITVLAPVAGEPAMHWTDVHTGEANRKAKAYGVDQIMAELTPAELATITATLDAASAKRPVSKLTELPKTIRENAANFLTFDRDIELTPATAMQLAHAQMDMEALDAKARRAWDLAHGPSTDPHYAAAGYPKRSGEAKALYDKLHGGLYGARSSEKYSKALSAAGYTPERALIATLQASWAQSSTDPMASAMQRIVAKHTGATVPGRVPSAAKVLSTYGPAIEAVVASTYRVSQAYLAKHKLSTVAVFRGVKKLAVVGAAAVTGNPLSSWSTVRSTAALFGPAVFAGSVPASQVWSVAAATGIGCYDEQEMILYGGSTIGKLVKRSELALNDDIDIEDVVDIDDPEVSDPDWARPADQAAYASD